jgi:hypothetical protein
MHPFRKPTKRPKKPTVEVFPCGREVVDQTTEAGRREYQKRLRLMISRQLNRCAICLKVRNDLSFDHALGRGHGGGHRDDRIWDAQGNLMNAALCIPCNGLKGSKRYEWNDGVYMEVAR